MDPITKTHGASPRPSSDIAVKKDVSLPRKIAPLIVHSHPADVNAETAKHGKGDGLMPRPVNTERPRSARTNSMPKSPTILVSNEEPFESGNHQTRPHSREESVEKSRRTSSSRSHSPSSPITGPPSKEKSLTVAVETRPRAASLSSSLDVKDLAPSNSKVSINSAGSQEVKPKSARASVTLTENEMKPIVKALSQEPSKDHGPGPSKSHQDSGFKSNALASLLKAKSNEPAVEVIPTDTHVRKPRRQSIMDPSTCDEKPHRQSTMDSSPNAEEKPRPDPSPTIPSRRRSSAVQRNSYESTDETSSGQDRAHPEPPLNVSQRKSSLAQRNHEFTQEPTSSEDPPRPDKSPNDRKSSAAQRMSHEAIEETSRPERPSTSERRKSVASMPSYAPPKRRESVDSMLYIDKKGLAEEVKKLLPLGSKPKSPSGIPEPVHVQEPFQAIEESRDDSLEEIVEIVESQGQQLERKEYLKKRLKAAGKLFAFLAFARRSADVQAYLNLPIITMGNEVTALILKQTPLPADPGLTAKVIAFAESERSEAAIMSLESILRFRVKSMQRFTLTQRLAFLRVMNYESFPLGAIIVKEGHLSQGFYFLLSGQVHIYKLKDNKRLLLNALNSGDSFGDRTMNLTADKRTATVVCSYPCELLRIDKTSYLNIVQVKDELYIQQVYKKLETIPLFISSYAFLIDKLARICHISNHDPKEVIMVEGLPETKIFWLLKGTCKVMKSVPFYKHLNATGVNQGKITWRPCEPGSSPNKIEELTKETIMVKELEEFDFFPPLEINGTGALREDYLTSISSRATVVTTSKVELAAINISSLVLAAPKDLLELLRAPDHPFNYAIADIQAAFMQKQNWETFRQGVLARKS